MIDYRFAGTIEFLMTATLAVVHGMHENVKEKRSVTESWRLKHILDDEDNDDDDFLFAFMCEARWILYSIVP